MSAVVRGAAALAISGFWELLIAFVRVDAQAGLTWTFGVDGEQVRRAALAEAPKHGNLLHSARSGARLSALMLPFFLLWAPAGYGILTYTGRKTGKRRRKCLRAVRDDQSVYLLMLRPPGLAVERPTAVAAWVYNVRASPQVSITLGRKRSRGTIREISDDTERERARAALCDRVHLVDYGECDLHIRGLPTRAKIKALHRYWFDTGIPFAIDLAT